MCIGLICTPEGLPLSYEVLSGNRTDVTTVEEIVKMLEEKHVLCRSTARGEKERAMLERQSQGLAANWAKIQAWLVRSPQADLEKVKRRIGRVLAKYPAAARIIEARVEQDVHGQSCNLCFFSHLESGQRAHHRQGVYLLRTNCEETDPATIWRWYIQLISAEAAFHTAKSDLGLRPIFHHLKSRVEAHILVCFLALALWRSLELWMSAKGLGTSVRKLMPQSPPSKA